MTVKIRFISLLMLLYYLVPGSYLYAKIQNNNHDERVVDSLALVLNVKISELDRRLDDVKNERERYMSHLSYVTTAVLTLAGLMVALGGVLLYKENKRLIDIADKEVRLWVEKNNGYFDKIKKNIEKELDLYRDYLTLRILLYNNIPKDIAEKNVVFSLLTNLVNSTKEEYAPLFQRIIRLNFDKESTKKAEQGMERIRNM